MTKEHINALTDSISNLSLNKEITVPENGNNETDISNPTKTQQGFYQKLIQNSFTITIK